MPPIVDYQIQAGTKHTKTTTNDFNGGNGNGGSMPASDLATNNDLSNDIVNQVNESGNSQPSSEDTPPYETVADEFSNPPLVVGSNFTEIKGNTYMWTQNILSTVWDITYPAGRRGFPLVSIMDTSGRQILIQPQYISNEQVRITFGYPLTGIAILKF